MPGIGPPPGGLIVAGSGPRTTFWDAGICVLAIAGIAGPLLGARWPKIVRKLDPRRHDSGDEEAPGADLGSSLGEGQGRTRSHTEVGSQNHSPKRRSCVSEVGGNFD